MADEVGSLNLRMAMEGESFTAGIKRVNSELKELDSAFAASTAEAKAAGDSYDEMGSRAEYLGQKLEMQQSAIDGYKDRIAELTQSQSDLLKAQEDLPAKIEEAKKEWEASKEALAAHTAEHGKNAESTKALAAETARLGDVHKGLANELDIVERSLRNKESAITRTETSYNKLREQAANTRVELQQVNEAIAAQANGAPAIDAAAQSFGNLNAEMKAGPMFDGKGANLAKQVLGVLGMSNKEVGMLAKSFGQMKQMGGSGGLASILGGVGPWMAIGAAISGVVWLLGEAERKAGEFNERIAGFDFGINDKSVEQIQAKIDGDKHALSIKADVQLEMQIESDEIKKKLEKAFDDDKVTRKEGKAISKALSEAIVADIDAAQTDVETRVKSFETWLSTLKVEGSPSLDEGLAESVVASMQSETSNLIAELESAQEQAEALRIAIQGKSLSMVEAEVAQLETLLDRIAEIRTELKLAGDEAAVAAEASVKLIKAGKGTETEFATAVAAAKVEFDAKMAETKATAAENLAAAYAMVASVDEGNKEALEKASAALEATRAMNDSAIAAVTSNYAQNIQEMFDGIAQQYPEAAASLERVVQQYDLMAILQAGAPTAADAKALMGEYDLVADAIKNSFAMFGQDGKGLEEMLFGDSLANMDNKAIVEKLVAGLESGDIDLENMAGFENFGENLMDALKLNIEEGLENIEGNPMLDMLAAMFESGDLDMLEDLDLGNLSGVLEGMFKALDFQQAFEEEGRNGMLGLTAGIQDGAEGAAGAATLASTGLLEAARTALASHSPSMEFHAIGQDAIDGLIGGMQSKGSELNAAIMTLMNEAIAAAKSTLKIRSPSKVMEWIGDMTGEGWVQGLRKKEPEVAAATASMANASIGAAKGAASHGQGEAGGLTQHITVNSPKHLSAAEAARQIRRASQQLALGRGIA